MSIAKKSDWKVIDFPEKFVELEIDFPVSKQKELPRISKGLVPVEMENKWFMYYEEAVLNIHRSWTGSHIYKAFYSEENESFNRLLVNRDPEQYTQSDNEEDMKMFYFLVKRLLLNQDVPYPNKLNVSGFVKNAILHHTVGTHPPVSPKPWWKFW